VCSICIFFIIWQEVYIMLTAYQGLCETCSFEMSSHGQSDAMRVGAAIVYVAWPVGFLLYTVYFIRTKITHHGRAVIVRDRNNFLQWQDMPPKRLKHLHARLHRLVSHQNSFRHDLDEKHEDKRKSRKEKNYYSGFVASNGAVFENFRDAPAAIYCMSWLLMHRLAVGTIVGASVTPDPESTNRQLYALMIMFFVFLSYIIYVRPFIVPLANTFEALVIVCQLLAVVLNFWLVDANETVLGPSQINFSQSNFHTLR